MITAFEFQKNGIDVQNDRRITPTEIKVDTSLFSQSNCEFYMTSKEDLHVTNHETFLFIPQSKEGGGVITYQKKKGKNYTYRGKTFRRLLHDRYLYVDRSESLETHLIFNTANDALKHIFDIALPFVVYRDMTDGIFLKQEDDMSETEHNTVYQYRYASCYTAVMEILLEHELKLVWKIEPYSSKVEHVVCELHRVIDFTEEIEINKHLIDVDYTKDEMTSANHIVALGRGEMENRYIYELWRHDVGVWKRDKPKDMEERVVTYLYDYPNVEDDRELRRATKLKTRSIDKKVSHEFDFDEKVLRDTYSKLDVGDKVTLEKEHIVVSAISETIGQGDMRVKRAVEMGTTKGDIRDEDFVEDFNKI